MYEEVECLLVPGMVRENTSETEGHGTQSFTPTIVVYIIYRGTNLKCVCLNIVLNVLDNYLILNNF